LEDEYSPLAWSRKERSTVTIPVCAVRGRAQRGASLQAGASERRVPMSHRFFAAMGALAVVIAVALPTAVPVAGQVAANTTGAAKAWTVPRTPDGQPDLQGIWSNATLTPLERPRELAGKPFFTQEEAAEYEKRALQQNNADRRDNRDTEADV